MIDRLTLTITITSVVFSKPRVQTTNLFSEVPLTDPYGQTVPLSGVALTEPPAMVADDNVTVLMSYTPEMSAPDNSVDCVDRNTLLGTVLIVREGSSEGHGTTGGDIGPLRISGRMLYVDTDEPL
jgi:hypothetical protein